LSLSQENLTCKNTGLWAALLYKRITAFVSFENGDPVI